MLIFTLAALPLWGGQEPSIARGFGPANVFRNFDLDTVNEFNGNLVVRIPIGPVYPVGPVLRHQLTLTYNSKVWDYQYEYYAGNQTDPERHLRRAIPADYTNAGFGWLLGLGSLEPPRGVTPVTEARSWYYRAPDGSEHDFDPQTADPAEAHTRDGSFLRLTRHPENASLPATHREIEFPDGTVHKFNPSGDLTEIRDPLDYWISVDYSDPMKWVITHGYSTTAFRTITITFETRSAEGYENYPNFAKVVSTIDVPRFPVDGETRAVYSFTYADTELTKDCGDTLEDDPATYWAPLLTEVAFPDGSSYTPSYLLAGEAWGERCSIGVLNKLRLPTLGSIEWKQGEWKLPKATCDLENGWTVTSPGVRKRTLKDGAGNVIGTWTYSATLDETTAEVDCGELGTKPERMPYGPAPTELTTTVTVSDADNEIVSETKRYFTAVRNTDRAVEVGYKKEEFGLPFIRRVTHATKTGRFLSRQRYDGSNTLLRTTYLTYGQDPTNFDGRVANSRVAGELTIFNGDTGCTGGECWIDVDRPEDDYDGFGHQEKTVTTSSFGPSRTTFTNYTPDEEEWILGTYDSAWVSENNVVRKEQFDFDDDGLLKSRRTFVNTASDAANIQPNDADLLAAYCRNTRGFLTSERFFGGDGAAEAIPSDPCATNPGATQYRIDHTFTFNSAGAPTKHTAKYNGTTFFSVDEDLDAATGLVKVSRDVSAVPTSFSYDNLGRITEIVPTGSPWSLFEYTNAASTSPASLRITTREAGQPSTASPLTDAWVYYNAIGDAVQIKREMPAAAGLRWATTETEYDLFGRKTSVSVPEFRTSSSFEAAFVPAAKTSYAFDSLGRMTSVVGPDGKTASTAYTGNGTRVVSKTVAIATTTGGVTNETTVETYDAHGRLTKIGEPNGTISEYTYDSADRLVKVCQNVTGTTCGQTRTFTYDGRGFMTKEEHPEMSAVEYTYDARGHVLTETVENQPGNAANLQYTWDAAERIERVETNGAAAWKEFEYGTANSGADKKLGKLVSATRYNDSTAGEIKVTETHTYGDTAGRLTKTKTEIFDGDDLLQTLEQGQTYDETGSVGTLSYPRCLSSPAACGDASWDQVSFTSTGGLLTAVQGFADEIAYTAAGAVESVEHDGPVTDTYTADVTAVRPKTIAFSGYFACASMSMNPDTPADRTVSPGQQATLTVSASGATGYQWFKGDGTKIAGATAAQYTTPALTADQTYYAEAYSDCKTVKSRTATVTVACDDVSIAPQTPADQSIAPEETATLTVTATGATSYQWFSDNGTEIAGATSSSYTTPPLTSFRTYFVRASNGCQTVQSRTATVTVRSLSAPTGLVAQAVGTSVTISWNPSPDADHYILERKANGSGFLPVLSLSGTSTTQTGLAPNTTYVYRVRATSPNEIVSSSPSNSDLATTMTFTPLQAGVTEIAAAHFDQLLAGVNAVRAARGAAAVTWASILPAGVSPPAPGGIVDRQHVLSLRSAMDSARTTLGFSALSYADATLEDLTIKVQHVTEIRGGVE